jgi:hypothetical protein
VSDPRLRRLDQREVDRYRGQRLERQKAALVLGSRGNRRGDQQVLDPDAEGASS